MRISNLLDYLLYKYEHIENRLKNLPKVYKNMHHSTLVYRCQNHEHFASTEEGKALESIYNERLKLKHRLKDLNNAINIVKQSMKPCKPLKLQNQQNLTQCRMLFGDWDKLRIIPNEYPDKKHFIHNGIDYDSKAEVKISEIYELLNIPFKHSAEIRFPNGFTFAADFVPLIEETGDYFIHEHFGRDMTNNYLFKSINKFSNIVQNELILGKDVLFTIENQDNFADEPYYISSIVGTLMSIINAEVRVFL